MRFGDASIYAQTLHANSPSGLLYGAETGEGDDRSFLARREASGKRRLEVVLFALKRRYVASMPKRRAGLRFGTQR